MSSSENNGIVYHYCSLETFKNIIANKSLWLCDVQKSNDSKECMALPECIKELAVEQNLRETYPPEQRKLFDRFINFLGHSVRHTYTICFSRKRDDLNQWRGYASDGTGLCIGFRKHFFMQLNKPEWPVLLFKSVDYTEKGIENCAESYLEELKGIIDGSIKYGERMCNTDQDELLHRLFTTSSTFKKTSFYEEAEERLIFSTSSYVTDYRRIQVQKCADVYLDRGRQEYFKTQTHDFELSALKYRIARNQLQGYYELSFAPIKDELISEIIIGPKSLVQEEDIYLFLAAYGYHEKEMDNKKYNQFIVDNINVCTSELSYR